MKRFLYATLALACVLITACSHTDNKGGVTSKQTAAYMGRTVDSTFRAPKLDPQTGQLTSYMVVVPQNSPITYTSQDIALIVTRRDPPQLSRLVIRRYAIVRVTVDGNEHVIEVPQPIIVDGQIP